MSRLCVEPGELLEIVATAIVLRLLLLLQLLLLDDDDDDEAGDDVGDGDNDDGCDEKR